MKKESFGEKIRRLRTERGISCSELSSQSGISKVSIHSYEKGHSIPTLSGAKKIAKVLGVTLADFEDCLLPEDGREKSTKTT